MNFHRRRVSICALVAVRNEACYLHALLTDFARQDIDVVVFDHGSSDETRAILNDFAPSPILDVKHLHFDGSFSLSDQLRAKDEVASSLPHDWIIYQDADEILEHRDPRKELRDAIYKADARGFNALNFDEFVFLPLPGESHTSGGHQKGMLRYYFFKPNVNRLNRAWRRTLSATTTDSGGHRLRGTGVRICKTNHILRHYIVLSQEHAYKKYLGRSFSKEDLARGWHTNRVKLSRRMLQLPERHDFIFSLPHPRSKRFKRSHPVDKHYWHWGNPRCSE